MTKISWQFGLALALIGGVAGLGIGYVLTPGYSMTDKTRMDLGRPDRTLDLRYLNAMIAHHRGAMLLAEQAKKSGREEIRTLAEDILASEPKLIDELYAWKREWYGDRRSVQDL
jgi:uncharacterized protein (DUF305 family)